MQDRPLTYGALVYVGGAATVLPSRRPGTKDTHLGQKDYGVGGRELRDDIGGSTGAAPGAGTL